GHAAADLRHDLTKQCDAVLLAGELCLLGPMQKRVWIPEKLEHLRPECQHEAEIEGMSSASRIGLGSLIRGKRLIGITHHPEILAAIDAFAGERIGVRE